MPTNTLNVWLLKINFIKKHGLNFRLKFNPCFFTFTSKNIILLVEFDYYISAKGGEARAYIDK